MSAPGNGPPEWVGEVMISSGRHWHGVKVRVRAGGAHVAARRAILVAKGKAPLPRRFRTLGIWIQLTRVPRSRKEAARGQTL